MNLSDTFSRSIERRRRVFWQWVSLGLALLVVGMMFWRVG